jgi:hypothetical protein
VPKATRRVELAYGNPYKLNGRPSSIPEPEPPTPQQTRDEITAALSRYAETGEYPSDEVWERMASGLRERVARGKINPPINVSASGPVVYYFRVGNRIKIGYTGNLAGREKDLAPEEVLGWEPGSYELERRRHEQFAAYRVTREWFEDCSVIRKHIASLKKE